MLGSYTRVFTVRNNNNNDFILVSMYQLANWEHFPK